MSLRPRGMHRRIAMLSAKHPESRDLSPSAKLQCERGLTSLGRFEEHERTFPISELRTYDQQATPSS